MSLYFTQRPSKNIPLGAPLRRICMMYWTVMMILILSSSPSSRDESMSAIFVTARVHTNTQSSSAHRNRVLVNATTNAGATTNMNSSTPSNTTNSPTSAITKVFCIEPVLRSTGAITLLYNYKVETLPSLQTQLLPTLKKLESIMIQQLATDLLSCTKYTFTATRRIASVLSSDDTGIMGFDTSPIDSISTSNTCTPILNFNNNCTVMNGAMNIYLTASAPPDDVVRYTVLSLIQNSMSKGLYTDTIPGIFLVQYVGPVILTPQDTLMGQNGYPSTTSTSKPNNTHHTNITTTQIIILTAILTFSVIAVGIFILSILFPKKNISAVCKRTNDIEFTTTPTTLDMKDNSFDTVLVDEENDHVSSGKTLKKYKTKESSLPSYPQQQQQQNHHHRNNTITTDDLSIIHEDEDDEDDSVMIGGDSSHSTNSRRGYKNHLNISSNISLASDHSAQTRKTGRRSRSKESRLSVI